MLFKEWLQFNKKFSSATSWLVFPCKLYLLQNHFFLHMQAQCFAHVLVICLWRKAQQSADSLQANGTMCLFYFPDCWLPCFFLMEILSLSSATLINVSSASARSFSHWSCFSSAAIFFSKSCVVFCFLGSLFLCGSSISLR